MSEVPSEIIALLQNSENAFAMKELFQQETDLLSDIGFQFDSKVLFTDTVCV